MSLSLSLCGAGSLLCCVFPQSCHVPSQLLADLLRVLCHLVHQKFKKTRPKPAYGRQGLDWDRWARIQFSQVHFGAKLDSTDLLWCKNVTSPTGGSNRPFGCLEEGHHFWHLSRMFPKNILDMISSSTNTLEAFEKLQY